MHIHSRVRSRLAFVALALLPFLPATASADAKHLDQCIVYFRDGFTVQGQCRREGFDQIEAESKVIIFIPSGFFFIDDGARRTYLSPAMMERVDKVDLKNEEKVIYARPGAVDPKKIPPVEEVLNTTNWTEKWDRDWTFRSGVREITIEQHLGILTPTYARTDAMTGAYKWTIMYLTRELGPDACRELLSTHPDLREQKDLAPAAIAARRERYWNFFFQAGWYDEAEAELDRLVKDFPDKKDLAEKARAEIEIYRSKDLFEDIKRLHHAGQFQAVRDKLAVFPAKSADPKTLADFQGFKSDFAKGDKALEETGGYLKDLTTDLKGGGRAALLADAAASILADLQPDNVARLDAFLGQARQADRLRKAGKVPTPSAEELASLAVTGWLMGSVAADKNPETGERMWRGRQFVLQYLQTDAAAKRAGLVSDYTKNASAAATLDELTQMIPRLPPPNAEQKIVAGPVAQTTGGRVPVSYLLQLPPEYRHGRSYPVLFVLHKSGETPKDMLDRWKEDAAREGYILVAPEWQSRGNDYGYTEQEHATVLETLKDLRRRFAVDSDRVFLFGLEQGGAMAYDVGLSHPDLFAGVLPMSAGPMKFSERYYANGQLLPFYVVDGDRSGELNAQIREEFGNWVTHKCPMLWVQYKGRGVEWFAGEVQPMFDWMRPKTRPFPLQILGVDNGDKFPRAAYSTMRTSDNSFYWLATDSILASHLNSPAFAKAVIPATMSAWIDVTKNMVVVQTTGVDQVTVWLGRNGKGESMVDFEQPVIVRVNGNVKWKDKVAPSLATLLEDLYQRGDRQRLFVGRLDLTLGK